MSTTTNPLAATRLSLRDVVCAMSASCPAMNAAPDEVAAWFQYCVALLGLIARDRSHPEHDEACELAAKYSHDAIAAGESARGKGTSR